MRGAVLLSLLALPLVACGDGSPRPGEVDGGLVADGLPAGVDTLTGGADAAPGADAPAGGPDAASGCGGAATGASAARGSSSGATT